MRVLKVKGISLPYIFQVLYVLCFTRPRYQLSVYRTIGPFLAHLSRRLTGELIGYPWIRRPSVRPSVVIRPFTFSNIFSSETAWPIKAKFYVEPPWEGGTKVCINSPGRMTKVAAMPIYGKNLKKSSSPEPAGRFPRNLVCSIGDSCPS